MNRRRAVAMGILASSALACGALVVAQQTQKQSGPPEGIVSRVPLAETSRESHLTGVRVVRLINTAEINYKQAHGSYATWDELFRSGAISAREKPATQFQRLKLTAGPQVVPGWNLAIVVSADRRNYELSLRSVDDKQCRFSFFSDDSGLIYEGGVIDCSVQLVPAKD